MTKENILDNLYFEFWKNFLAYAKKKPHALNFTRKNQGRYYYNFVLGIGNNVISFSAKKKENVIGCELYLQGDKAKYLFHELEKYRDQINSEFSIELDWRELPDRNDCRIMVKRDGSINNKNDWLIYFQWFIENGEQFKNIFSKYASQVLNEEKNKYYKSSAINISEIRIEDEELTFKEGKEKFIQHRSKERDSRVGKLAKKKRLEEKGELRCDVCNFSFFKTYGTIGEGYIEAHHTVPISEINDERETKIEEIALVCSNCHRMLHIGKKLLSIDELKNMMNII